MMTEKVKSNWSSDPREDTLSPFTWIPLILITLICFLFISIRRTKSLEYYNNSLNYLQTNFPILFNSNTTRNRNRNNRNNRNHHRIRLNSDLESSSSSIISSNSSDDDDEDDDDVNPLSSTRNQRFPSNSNRQSQFHSSSTSNPQEDTSDELPRIILPSRLDLIQDWIYIATKRLLARSNDLSSTSTTTSSPSFSNTLGPGGGGGGGRVKEAGIGRHFWGLRGGNGSIQLPNSSSSNSRISTSRSSSNHLQNSNSNSFLSSTSLLERVPSSLFVSSTPSLPPPSSSLSSFNETTLNSPRVSSIPNLFDLGEEEEEEEQEQEFESAVELPREVGLGEMNHWGSSSSSSTGAGGGGGFPSRGLR